MMRRFTASGVSVKANSTIRTFFPGFETALAVGSGALTVGSSALGAGGLAAKAGLGIFTLAFAQQIKVQFFHQVAIETRSITLNALCFDLPVNNRMKLLEVVEAEARAAAKKNRPGMLASLFSKNEATRQFYENARELYEVYSKNHPGRGPGL